MNRPPIQEVVAETGEPVEAPPPEMVEPEPGLSAEEIEELKRDYLLTRFWISARGFWGAGGGRLAWVLSIGLFALIVLQITFQYGINVWNRSIFDAIEKKDASTVLFLTGVFFPLAIGSVVIGVVQVFARMSIQRRWRAWLTNSVVSRWLTMAATISSLWSTAITRILNTGSQRICGLRPMRRSISPQVSRRRFSRRPPSSSCCGPSAAR